jgi:hypothetical protein
MDNLKYPIGEYAVPKIVDTNILNTCILTIKNFPDKLKSEVNGLTAAQLKTPYRPEGWTIEQLVNHCADSHMNALIRVKLALTEQTPVINPYKQELWAELADGSLPIRFALSSLEGTHARWAAVLESLTEKQWNLSYFHPEKKREVSLKESAGSYAWHCEHHLAHVTELKKRMGWV